MQDFCINSSMENWGCYLAYTYQFSLMLQVGLYEACLVLAGLHFNLAVSTYPWICKRAELCPWPPSSLCSCFHARTLAFFAQCWFSARRRGGSCLDKQTHPQGVGLRVGLHEETVSDEKLSCLVLRYEDCEILLWL